MGLAIGPPPVGESRLHGAGSRARFRKIGRLVFTPASVPFDIRGSGGEVLVAACSISGGLFRRLSGDLAWDERLLEACSDIYGTPIEAAMTRLLGEASSPGFASDIMLEAGGAMIAVELTRFLRRPGCGERPKARRLSAQQIALIEELADESATTLEEIAARSGLSIRTLTRNFKATTGRTISALIEEARIRRARALLSDRSLPLKVVAHRSGFANAGSFGAAFRRATGQTPGQFRSGAIS
ncbi:helix-turn-helix transcriptional regulator [Sphingomonas sp. DBB INV C78]|uniref:helix-turn-helix transcriptional regulator n=1 Tax=Sphingomonas sp. DBB INV C78 TaxID=3349434 RepID=UPI0036D22F8A